MSERDELLDPLILAAAEERLAVLASISEEPEAVVRTFQSGAMCRAMAEVAGWMEALGMEHAQDRAGSLIGRLAALGPSEQVLLLGSHVDTPREGGAGDGALGVVVAIAALEELCRRGVRPGYHVDVVVFADEEGARFGTSHLGSRYLMGGLPREELEATDADGVSLGEAIAALAVERPHAGYGSGDRFLGYVECQVEKGNRLGELDLGVGVVSSVGGQTRARFRVVGNRGDAGLVSMDARRDALVGAAELVLLAESLAGKIPGLTATVGCLEVEGAAADTVPGEVLGTLEIRSAEDAVRLGICRDFEEQGRALMERRGLGFEFRKGAETATVRSSERLVAPLEAVARRVQGDCALLQGPVATSAVSMAGVMDVAVLAVRSRGGADGDPRSPVSAGDMGAAIRVLADFLESLNDRLE